MKLKQRNLLSRNDQILSWSAETTFSRYLIALFTIVLHSSHAVPFELTWRKEMTTEWQKNVKTGRQLLLWKKIRAPANTVTWFVQVASDRSLRAYKAGAWPSYVQGRFYLYRKWIEGIIKLSNPNLSQNIHMDNISACRSIGLFNLFLKYQRLEEKLSMKLKVIKLKSLQYAIYR